MSRPPDFSCPYCLARTSRFAAQGGLYVCPNCKTAIPRGYVEAPAGTPRANIGLVGFSGHGKTVYLTSLFSMLGQLSGYWPQYYYRSLDDYTHKILYEQAPMFEQGRLPESTPANFPNPALVHYHQLPVFQDAFLAFYDTAGEVFSDAEHVSRAGYFVAHADVALFIMSLDDCDPNRLDDEMCRLLDVYVRSVYDRLQVDLRSRQRLVVVLTKADLLLDRLTEPLVRWLLDGSMNWYGSRLGEKILDLTVMSINIEDWLRNDMKCYRFLNLLDDYFAGSRFALVSATGPGFDLNTSDRPNPLRVLDPFFAALLFVLEGNRPVKVSFRMRLMERLSGVRRQLAERRKR